MNIKADIGLTGKESVAIALHQFGSVEFMRSGAYVRLNDIAECFGKRLDNWTRLKSTQAILTEFGNDPVYQGEPALKVVMGKYSSAPSDLREHSVQGTFAHPDIAIQFAQWCSPAFALWVSRQIRHLLTYGEVNLHYREWGEEQYFQGQKYNRDDLEDLNTWREKED